LNGGDRERERESGQELAFQIWWPSQRERKTSPLASLMVNIEPYGGNSGEIPAMIEEESSYTCGLGPAATLPQSTHLVTKNGAGNEIKTNKFK